MEAEPSAAQLGGFYREYFASAISCLQRFRWFDVPQIAGLIRQSARRSGTAYTAGNGGSAATALHFASDLISARGAGTIINSNCLNANASTISAVANDFGFEFIFSRQLSSLRPEDLLFVFSVSGASDNVLEAAKWASHKSCPVIALTGPNPGKLASFATCCLVVDHQDYGIVESIHMMICHAIQKSLMV